MFHPQPASTLLLNPTYEARARRHDQPGPLLTLLVSLRNQRAAGALAAVADEAPVATEPAGGVAHAAEANARTRSELGGRREQARRRRGPRALRLRRRGDIHTPGSGTDRRGR